LMERTYELLNAIVLVYMKSETGTDLPALVLRHIGRFTEQVLSKTMFHSDSDHMFQDTPQNSYLY
jgi:hypothetical protein